MSASKNEVTVTKAVLDFGGYPAEHAVAIWFEVFLDCRSQISPGRKIIGGYAPVMRLGCTISFESLNIRTRREFYRFACFDALAFGIPGAHAFRAEIHAHVRRRRFTRRLIFMGGAHIGNGLRFLLHVHTL